MKTLKVTKNIWFHELVPKEYGDVTERDLRFLDINLLNAMQRLRDYFGKPMIINDDTFNWRGLRTPDFDRYNPGSMHSIWRAYDHHIVGVDPEEEREYIIDNRDEFYPEIMAIEDKVNWIHLDTRYRPDNTLLVFKP